MNDGISVIICCYNSENLIERTLFHLLNQKTSTLKSWEVILVDNNCTDKTVEKAIRFWETRSSIPLLIVKEKTPGLMSARKAGVSIANFSIILFCDDDNHLSSNYLEKAYQIMGTDEKIGIVGGFSNGIFEGESPNWFKYLESGYAVGKQSENEGDITFSKGHIWGAGMVCRTSVLLKVLKGEFVSSGRKGNSLLSGDDTEICYKVIAEGYKIFYDPELRLDHFIVKKRLEWNYAIKMEKGHVKTLIKLAELKSSCLNNQNPSGRIKDYKDLFYLLRKNFSFTTLLNIRDIINIHKKEGNMELWTMYFKLYYLFSFFYLKILKK